MKFKNIKLLDDKREMFRKQYDELMDEVHFMVKGSIKHINVLEKANKIYKLSRAFMKRNKLYFDSKRRYHFENLSDRAARKILYYNSDSNNSLALT